MISKNTFPTYAQYNEDITLLALLSDVEKGFYVDVGANYPTVDSVTKLFYSRGWRGINIEPLPELYRQLKKERPQDINLQIGIGDEASQMEFYENIEIPGHSSFSRNEAAKETGEIKTHSIKIMTLAQVFKEFNVKDIHFLKIDVEGFEDEVIRGNDWAKFRPFVICIESNHRKTDWQKTLLENRYRLFINDGLNEYYIAEEQWGRTDDYAERAVKLSYHALRQHQFESWGHDSKQLKTVTKLNQQHYEIVQSLNAENERLRYENKFSLLNKGYRDKAKLILKSFRPRRTGQRK